MVTICSYGQMGFSLAGCQTDETSSMTGTTTTSAGGLITATVAKKCCCRASTCRAEVEQQTASAHHVCPGTRDLRAREPDV